jgi:hypothetical protein
VDKRYGARKCGLAQAHCAKKEDRNYRRGWKGDLNCGLAERSVKVSFLVEQEDAQNSLRQWFPKRVPWTLRVPQNIVNGSASNSGINT